MPSADVYLCDKLEDHGKGTVCKRVVAAGVSVELMAYPLPLVDGQTVTVARAFCNVTHAQHWLRRIAVKDLLAPVSGEAFPELQQRDQPVPTEQAAPDEEPKRKRA